MGDLTTIETIHRMYMSIVALVFNLMLCVMYRMVDSNEKDRNRSFGALAFVVFFGNVLTILTSYVRRADSVTLPPMIVYLTYLLQCLSNIYVCSFFSQYIESYFHKDGEKLNYIQRFNRILLIVATILLAVLYIYKLPSFDASHESAAVEPWVRYFFGYALELYFILYSIVYFVRFRNALNKRAFLTAVWGIIVTIGGIVAQLVFSSILVNYVGATLGLFLFYFGVETPDYRKLRQTMDELREARIAADRANHSKSEFLANMSHEIRTPINAVLGMNEMILRESDNEKITSYARNVESSGKNLLSIINDILDFSKIEAGHMEIVENNYNLRKLLNDLNSMIRFRAEKKGLEFDIFVDKELPDDLYGDEVRIRQIVTNLLTNSVKYTREGNVSLTVEGYRKADLDDDETIKLADDEILLTFAVSDTGIGIREEDKGKLYSQFERVDMDQTRTIEGTGLGLAITYDLTVMMGGRIDLISSYGVGSTFTVKIPQKVIGNAPVGDYSVETPENRETKGYRESFTAPEARILVVDDTALNLLVFKELLKKTQVQIDTARSAGEAIRLTMDTVYDVIFMDQRMPHTDGIQAMNMIREQHGGSNRETPIICLTADAVSGARERYIAAGFVDYLTKPVESEKLESMLCRYLPETKVIMETTDGK